MSRAELSDVTNIGRPLTEEEKVYLHNRSRDWEIDENDRRYGGRTNFKELSLFDDVGSFDEPIDLTKDQQQSQVEQASPPATPEQHDFSKFDTNLVKQIKLLTPDDLRAELASRDVPFNKTDNKEHLQFLLVQDVSKEAAKG